MIKKTKKTFLLVVALLLVLTGFASQSDAGVDVNVGDDGVNVTVGGQGVNVTVGNNLPVYRFPAPPDLVVIPGTYVYMVPDIEMDLLYYQNYWWRPYEGRWYRSRDYNGQWSSEEPRRIPNAIRSLPHDYRHRLSSGYERLPHRDVERNWERWEKEKYWDSRGEQGRGSHDGDRRRGGNDGQR
jgi:hypothetical protein